LSICADSGWEALADIGARLGGHLAISDTAEANRNPRVCVAESWLRSELTIRPNPRPVCQASRYTRAPIRRIRISR
jgi:hypothetical protein